jgi:hypothetical protein
LNTALFVYGDSDGKEVNTSQYRILIPAKFLEKLGHKILIGSMPGTHRELGDSMIEVDQLDYSNIPEVVLFERNILPERVDKLRLAGAKKIVVTFDDHYGEMPAYNVSKPWWERNYKGWLKALGMVDLVIVPSLALVDAYRSYCKEIAYVPNFLDDDIWKETSTLENKIIGWGGSDAHVESWSQKLLVKALLTFFEKHPDWTLRLYGSAPRKTLPDSLLQDSRQWVKFSEWPKEVAQFTIGIAPLNGIYDRYRSNLKPLEFACAGVPWIGSNYYPYTKTLVRGGLLAYQSEWGNMLECFATDEGMRNTYAAEGRKWAEGMMMSQNTKVYERLLWGME